MRLLIDSCVWALAVPPLRAAGHDVEAVADWPRDPGDAEILAHAYANRRVLVTLDKDFGELAIFRGQPHCGILRLVGIPLPRLAELCMAAIEKHGVELERGAIATVLPDRVRLRPP